MTTLEDVLDVWRRSEKRGLDLRVGPAGGGAALVRWITDRTRSSSGEIAVEDLSRSPGQPLPADATRFVVVRSIDAPVASVDDVTSVDVDSIDMRSTLADLLQEVGVDRPTAEAVADRLSPATLLADELAGGPIPDGLLGSLDDGPLLRGLWQTILATGPRSLDLGRVLLLMRPREISLSDEWPLLASKLTGRVVSARDVSVALVRLPWLFSVDHSRDNPVATPRNPLAIHLLAGRVPVSGSEHFALYQALRDRARDALVGRDSADRFITEQLPRQAMASFSFEDLFQDAMAVLCSDPVALVREIESDPKLVLNPGAKAVLLCAHQLQSQSNPGSSLELSALRVGLQRFAGALADALPDRPWRTEWTRAQPVNANRIILGGSSPVLACSSGRSGQALVGRSDGTAWLVSGYEDPKLVWDHRHDAGEVRGADLFVPQDGPAIAALATSDQRVVALDCSTGEELWSDNTTHAAPLSAIAVSHNQDPPYVASSGVDGIVRLSPLLLHQSTDVRILHTNEVAGQSIEIRSLRFITTGRGLTLMAAGVDGNLVVIPVDTEGPTVTVPITDAVINSIAVTSDGECTSVVAGTSDGRVLHLVIDADSIVTRPVRSIREHAASVNSVDLRARPDGVVAFAASSDRTWSSTPLEGVPSESIEGHFGPLWTIASIATPDADDLVLTGGSDGCCRVWVLDAVLRESLLLEKPTRHAGPVTAIAVRRRGDDIDIWTGGDDGELRTWSSRDAASGRSLSQDAASVSALAVGPRTEDGTSPVYYGTVRGELYRVDGDSAQVRRRVLLGVAHDGITALRFARFGERGVLLSGGRDGAIMAWDVATDELTTSRQVSPFGEVTAISTIETPDGKDHIVAGTQEGLVSFRDIDDLREVWHRRLPAPIGAIATVPFHRAGLVVGLADGTIRFVRDARQNDDEWLQLGRQDGDVTGATAFVVGGRIVVATAGLDRRLRLWDLSTRMMIQEIALDGVALDLSADSPSVAVATTAGAAVFSFSEDPLILAGRSR